MSDHLDPNRYPARYELDAGDGSARQLWALVAIIAVGALLIILVSGFGRTTVEHPGGATAVSESGADDGTAPAETLAEPEGQ